MQSSDAPPTRIEWVSQAPLTYIAANLFREYQSDIGVDLSWQGFEQELAQLPGEYAAPHGMLLVAFVGDDAAGCCAFRPLHDCDYPNACEMKRLFVRKAFRGFGIGRLLVDHTLLHAKQAGYSTMLLDTLTDMETARALYAQAGFVEVPPYYHNPMPGAHYLKVDLE
jgi:putative acetyltransferase